MITVKIPLSVLLQDVTLRATAQTAVLLANIKRYTDGALAYWTNINPYNPATYMLLTHDMLHAVVAAGGEIEGLPLWFHVPAVKASEVVPDALPNATYTDDAGEVQTRIWGEWHDATHEIVTLDDGSLLVPSNAWGNELPASVAIAAADAAGVALLNVNEYKALLPEPAPETP